MLEYHRAAGQRVSVGWRAIHYYAQLCIPEMYALLLLVFLTAMLVNAGFSWLISRWTRYRHGGQSVPIP
jgi:ABC-type nitrate/sulfonate/bicarbonate transport system permease component